MSKQKYIMFMDDSFRRVRAQNFQNNSVKEEGEKN